MSKSVFAGAAVAALLVAVAGCNETSADPDSGTPPAGDGGETGMDGGGAVAADDLPCDVADVLTRNCLTCHADTPRFGAPMPLTSHAALIAPAETEPSTPVYEMVGRRIHDPDDPMPPPTSGTLSDADKAVLDAFVAAMAPERPAGETCGGGGTDGGVPPIGMVGPEHLPCTPSHEFLAHAEGSDTEPFHVPEGAGNLYECFSFASPFADGEQATAWAPVIDDDRVLHHWILYRTETPQEDGAVSTCSMPSDAQFVMGWAPGGPNAVMPSDVGLELGGPDSYYILQLHYWNVAGHAEANDRSGVAVCTTEAPRENTAGVLWLGSVAINIPPRAEGHVVSGTCPSLITSALTGPLNLLASGPHMHELGTHFITEIHRGGSASAAETLVEVDPWDFNTQSTYWHEDVVLNPGDSMVTRCTYDNPTDSTVTFGERTEDEMCFNFLTVYPLSNIPTTERRCLGF